jgi:hypothetical protein
MGDQACLLVLARDSDRAIGHLVGKLNDPTSIRTGRLAVLESMRVAPGSRRALRPASGSAHRIAGMGGWCETGTMG